MVRKRFPQSLKRVGLTKYAYKEMEYFCLQHRARKRQLAQLRLKLNKNEAELTRLRRLEREVGFVEDAAKYADEYLAPWLLKNATEGVAFDSIEVPCGRRQFYDARKTFFQILFILRERYMDSQEFFYSSVEDCICENIDM